jgi:hypothetical protein
MVSDDVVPDVVTVEADAYERMEAGERAQAVRHAFEKIDELLRDMDAEDRLILQMRFWDTRRVPDIAQTLHLDQKKVYKRLERLFGILRRALESAGVSLDDVKGLFNGGDEEIRLDLLPPPEIPPSGPSNSRGGGKARGREGRVR